MRVMLTVSLLVGSVFCSGCALTVDTEALSYHSTPGTVVVPGANVVTVDVETTDTRPGNHAQFSAKRNMFGMEMAPILSNRPAADVIRDALTEELRHRGFKIGPSNFVVAVDVRRFRSDYDVGFFGADSNAEVSIAITVRAPGGAVVYSQTVTGKGQEPMNQIMNGRNARTSLEAALASAMREITNDPTLFDALTNHSTPTT